MCTEDSPSGLWRTLGKRVGCKPSGVRIPHPPPLTPEPIEVPGFLLLVAPLVFPGAFGPGRPRALLPGLGGSLAGINRAAIALPRPGLVPRETCVKRRGRVEWAPGLDPTRLDPEALDDLRARERGKDLARHEELRTP